MGRDTSPRDVQMENQSIENIATNHGGYSMVRDSACKDSHERLAYHRKVILPR